MGTIETRNARPSVPKGDARRVNRMNLVVVAHPDDEILGFGATGAMLTSRGEKVRAVILCGGVDVRTRRPTDHELAADIEAANRRVGFEPPVLGDFPNIRMNTVDHVELVRFIEQAIAEASPVRVFTHHPNDLNDDHRQVARACMAAFRLFQRRGDVSASESLHYMEIQSATDWALDGSGRTFVPNLYVDIEAHLEAKLDALRCYRNVMRAHPHPRSAEAVSGLAAYRGGQSGYRFSEAFQTVFCRGL